jgi:hypothetical protein
MVEWYINDENGLEQGFTINNQPLAIGDQSSELVLNLAVSGDLTPNLTGAPSASDGTSASGQSGQAIEFTTPGGVRVLRYADLHAYDATGRQLPAHFSLSLSPLSISTISIVVDDENAVYPLTVDPLATSPSWTAESNQTGAAFGRSVGTAGDVNGDGYSDIIVGAPRYDGGQTDEGQVYVYYGSATGLSTTPDWMADSNQAGARFGISVGTAGDVNGDDYADIIIGAYYYDNDQTDEGRVYVYYGSETGLDATAGWTTESNQAFARFGWSVATAGDVNGDGYADVIVGASRYDSGQTDEGRAYVYHGSPSGLSSTADWTAESNQAGARFGVSVGAAGDVNGDGYADVIIGAWLYNNGQTDEGQAYVYYGSATGLSTTVDWTAESNQAGAYFGYSVSTAGDVNGDGYADVVVGATRYDNGHTDEGQAYVYHGSAVGLNTVADWTTESDQVDAHLGRSVSTAGDVNGDGYADIIVGAHSYDNGQNHEGRVWVYRGSAAGLGTAASWMVEGDQDVASLGVSVGVAGDVNGDGYTDVVVGAYLYDNGETDEGRAYVYYGGSTGLVTGPAVWTAEGNQAGALFGCSVGTAGDVNGDGYADVIVGAYNYDHGQTNEGRVFVYHGSAVGPSAAPNWTADGDQADASFGFSVGTAGDVNGDGYADIVVGARTYDNGQSNEGRAFVYHGSATGLTTSPDWMAESNQSSAYFGQSVNTAGDVNGDGYADIIIGAHGYSSGLGWGQGRVYVYHGSAGGLSATANWMAESNQSDSYFGYSVSTAGDVNGDSYADVIVGAHRYSHGQTDE